MQHTSTSLTTQKSCKNIFFKHSLTADKESPIVQVSNVGEEKKSTVKLFLSNDEFFMEKMFGQNTPTKLRLLPWIYFKQGRDSAVITQGVLWPSHSAGVATWIQRAWASPCLVGIKIVEFSHSCLTVFEPRAEMQAVCFPTPGFLWSWTNVIFAPMDDLTHVLMHFSSMHWLLKEKHRQARIAKIAVISHSRI